MEKLLLRNLPRKLFLSKRGILYFLVALSFGVLAVFLIVNFLFAGGEGIALVCDEKSFDFGRIEVKNGKAIGTHVFRIKNKSKQEIPLRGVYFSCLCVTTKKEEVCIAPGDAYECVVTMELPASDVQGRKVKITVVPKFEKIPSLELSISGKSGPSIFLEKEEISFSKIYRNEKKSWNRRLHLFCLSEKPINEFVSAVSTDKPDLISFSISKVESEKIVDAERDYFLQSCELQVSMNVDKTTPLGKNSGKIFLRFIDTTEKEVSIKWDAGEKEVFDGGDLIYISQSSIEKTYQFSVCYNKGVGGNPKNFFVSGKNLKILRDEDGENELWFSIEYTGEKKASRGSLLGELVVETENGHSHKLKVIAS